jgi:hypothetical protein
MDSNFQDPKQQERLHQQKMDAVKVLMSEIIDNPNAKDSINLKQVIDYLDKPTNNSVTDQ